MPTDAIMATIGICAIFLVFATALGWADRSTSRWLRDRDTAGETATGKKPPYQEAA